VEMMDENRPCSAKQPAIIRLVRSCSLLFTQ
jgi:hypothetical protein